MTPPTSWGLILRWMAASWLRIRYHQSKRGLRHLRVRQQEIPELEGFLCVPPKSTVTLLDHSLLTLCPLSASCRATQSGIGKAAVLPADSGFVLACRLPRRKKPCATAQTNLNRFDGGSNVNCSGTTTATGTTVPAYFGSIEVRDATLSLPLLDGRIAVVNCDSKFAERFTGPAGNRRDCRVPIVDTSRWSFREKTPSSNGPSIWTGRNSNPKPTRSLGYSISRNEEFSEQADPSLLDFLEREKRAGLTVANSASVISARAQTSLMGYSRLRPAL
jgi:hypothetical protein